MTDFKAGDRVKPKSTELESVSVYAGKSPDGTYMVTSAASGYVKVRSYNYPQASNYESPTIRESRFVKVQARMEGESIKPEDIEVGDEILVSRSGSDGIVHTRQGVVGEIKDRNDQYGPKKSFQSEIRGGKINWGQDFPETFTLIKAAPERDLLLERLASAPKGQVITFREVLARKQVTEMWDIFVTGALTDATTGELRDMIGKSYVAWMKAE